ncbi:MAG: response regulator [Ramlibacter sp.]
MRDPAADKQMMKILIVDDDEIARMALTNIVRGLPGVAGIVEAADGEQAWSLLDAGLRPVLCCCDIMMPRLDGLGLLQRTRAHPVLRDLPMVLITSASDRETVNSAISGGVSGYILKPFLAVQTRATLERVLRERCATEAEQVQATRRRLALEPEQLGRMLDRLRQDVAACQLAMQANADEAQAQLRRLYAGVLDMGLWRGATLLKDLLGAGAPPASGTLVIEEVARLVDKRLAAVAGSGPA